MWLLLALACSPEAPDTDAGDTDLPDEDLDGDGYLAAPDGDDCDDGDAAVYPGAPEVPYDGVDQDCSGTDLSDVDGDGVSGGDAGDDCDDADPSSFPGAPELCDGRRNDCADTTWGPASDVGVAYTGADGVARDVSSQFVGDPFVEVDTEPGAYRFCDGTYAVHLRVDTPGARAFRSLRGAEVTVLDGAADGVVVDVTVDADVTLEGLTLTHGRSTDSGGAIRLRAGASNLTVLSSVIVDNGARFAGGAIFAETTGEVRINATTLRGNHADAGGGGAVFIQGGALWLARAEVADNRSKTDGGAISANATVVTLSDDTFTNDVAASGAGVEADFHDCDVSIDGSTFYTGAATTALQVDGGSLAVAGSSFNSTLTETAMVLWNRASVDLEDSTITSYRRGAILAEDADLTCRDVTFWGNVSSGAVRGGAWVLGATSTATATSCHFGTAGSDNAPHDVAAVDAAGVEKTYDYGDDATFACGSGKCTK